jgi:TolB protein
MKRQLQSSFSALLSHFHPVARIIAAGVLLPISPTLHAEDAPLITITKSDKISLALNAITGAESAVITQTLQKDLQLSGAFTIGVPTTSSFLVAGAGTGTSLRGLVTERGGRVFLERSYQGNARTQAHSFANDIVETITGIRGIAGSKIAFVATRSGNKEIYLVESDGSGLTQLTRDSGISVSPRLSADGRRLAYTGYQSGYADVYEIDLSSGSRRRIMKYPGTNSGAAYSPNGDHFAVTLSKDGNPELYVTGSNGDSPRRLTTTPGVESCPTWSPDGREIIYSSDAGGNSMLYRISSSGGSPSQIRTGYSYNTEPHWSPDGKKVAFNVREGGSFQVAVLDLASGQARLVGEGQNPVWGPDSKHIVYASGGSLVLLDVVTLQRNSIVGGVGKISEPTWMR